MRAAGHRNPGRTQRPLLSRMRRRRPAKSEWKLQARSIQAAVDLDTSLESGKTGSGAWSSSDRGQTLVPRSSQSARIPCRKSRRRAMWRTVFRPCSRTAWRKQGDRLANGLVSPDFREKGCHGSSSVRRQGECWCGDGDGDGDVWASEAARRLLSGLKPEERVREQSGQRRLSLLTRIVVRRLIITARLRGEPDSRFRRSCVRARATRIRDWSRIEARVLAKLPTCRWWCADFRPNPHSAPRFVPSDVSGLEALRRLLFLCCEDGLGCTSVKRTHSRAMAPVNAPFPETVRPSALSWSSTRCAPLRDDEVVLRIDVLLRQLSSQSMRRGSL